jgi:flavin reductase (DIM6/NTAB) family NADH-FMN oxidoreductase RutF
MTLQISSISEEEEALLAMVRKRKAQEEKDETSTPSSKSTKTSGKKQKQVRLKEHYDFDPYPPSKVYRLIEPGPVLLVTTGSLADGTHNVMTIGFHMVIQHESPPLIGISLGPWDASFAALKKQRECVLAVPSVEMAKVVVDLGNCSKDDDGLEETSKWERFGLDAQPAGKVKAPLVGGEHIIANIECVVEDTKMVSKYSMWILKPVKAWINPNMKPGEGGKMFHHRGDGTFVVDGEVLDLKDRMVKWQEFQE